MNEQQSENQNHNRRAADSPLWKGFIRKEIVDSEIDWKRAFELLGGYFTGRILLRKELFSEIETWLLDPQNAGHADLNLMLVDCELTLKSLKRKGLSDDKLAGLQRVIDLMKKLTGKKRGGESPLTVVSG